MSDQTHTHAQGTCSHQRNPIDDRYRLAAAEDIVTRYPGIATDQPSVAAALSSYDAYVGEYGDTSLESTGVETFAS